ncbi:MAG: bifunctional 3-deoxy-7-phosphoheptulonate synthase/chorismate mutase type II [Lentimicrobiaceae bacterium]|nr:bifunctional 3-deoxy-7-phosphoheptulonate synthase/chorismate mutase type II [Lentimicrobiaceae bacterium]
MHIAPIIEKENKDFPLLIAGPCSAENKEQVFETARLLSETKCVKLFRCGIWKPRSSPNSFEGSGDEALTWLKAIETLYGLTPCIEIASPQHVEKAYKMGVTHYWIGARTSVNPFAVQELATACKGLDIAVMIKNPVSPDLPLWYGNFERFAQAGIKRMAAVYRGFSTGKQPLYRYDPLWQMLIDFKQFHREIPVFCDPSHIAGKRKYIYEIAQKALFLNVDGLMLETHVNPSAALSDKQQQLSVPDFEQLIRRLIVPTQKQAAGSILEKYREKMDTIDSHIFELLSERFEISKQIAALKKENNIPILQIERWEKVRGKRLNQANELNIDADFAENFLKLLHEASIKTQEMEMKG